MSKHSPVVIDGTLGEGGGQILRSALSLSLLTGRPLRLHHIRANRPKPGLRPQHLMAVQAAATIGDAHTSGDHKGSTRLEFTPGAIESGHYRFEIGTAGSTGLVLQTLLLPLSFASAPSEVTITGGTHVPWSPCFHYLQAQWAPFLRTLGFRFTLALLGAGYYPRGGGTIKVRIEPVRQIEGIERTQRGALRIIECLSAVTNLPLSIAERQKHQALKQLERRDLPVEAQCAELPGIGKGTLVMLLARFAESQACFTALGERGKRAEQVTDEAVEELLRFLRTPGAVDPHLADQVMLPLALGKGPSTLSTSALTSHLLTNIAIIQKFLPVRFEVERGKDQGGTIRIIP